MNALQLHDIKALETIPDYSFWILSTLVAFILFIMICVIYYLFQYFKNRNSSRKQTIQELKSLDMKDAKSCAYTITKLSKTLISNEREQKLYEELVEHLTQYKYKKRVETFDDKAHHLFKLLLDEIDAK